MAKDQRKKLKTVLKMTTFSNVKIGAYSNFFYCGKPDAKLVQKVSEEKREELICAMNRVLLELWNLKDDLRNEVRKNTLTSAKNILKPYMYSTTPMMSGDVRDMASKLSRSAETAVDAYLQKVADRDLRKLRDYAKRFSPWVGLLDRKVLTMYKSVTEEDTLIIIIEGNEVGKFWTTSEYVNGVSEEDMEDDNV